MEVNFCPASKRMPVVAVGELVRTASGAQGRPGPQGRAVASELPLATAGRTAQADPAAPGRNRALTRSGILRDALEVFIRCQAKFKGGLEAFRIDVSVQNTP